MRFDLNCDLGEGEARSRTRALMRWVSSVNVACGGHAGDVATMSYCARLAREMGVRLGAHPGLWDREGFGRAGAAIDPDAFELLVLHQVGALERVARAEGVILSHVKLHGALYHAVEADVALRSRYLECVRNWWPRIRLYALAGGAVAREARRLGVRVWEEVFADRGYGEDGTLMPRQGEGALLKSGAAVRRRVEGLVRGGVVVTDSGRALRLRVQTVCVHSDTPRAVSVARLARSVLEEGF